MPATTQRSVRSSPSVKSSKRPIWCAAPGRRRSSTAHHPQLCWCGRWRRCEARDDTRLSRVMIDLLGAIPAEGDLWVCSRVERSGKQIELVSAEMLAPGKDGEPRPVARASGWRLKTIDTAEVVHTSAATTAPAVRGPQPRHERRLGPQLRAQPRLAMADPSMNERTRRVVDHARWSTSSRARP